MESTHLLTLTAAFGLLLIAVVSYTRYRSTVLGRSIAMLSFCMFVWNFASANFHLTGDRIWETVDVTTSPLTFPIILDIVYRFTGTRRESNRAIGLSTATALALALSGLVLSIMGEIREELTWTVAYAGFVVIILATVTFELLRYGSESKGEEPLRSYLLLSAFWVGTLMGLTDLLNNVYTDLPSFSGLGALIAGTLVYISIFRFELFGSELSADRRFWVLWFGLVVGLAGAYAFMSPTKQMALAIILFTTPVVIIGFVIQSEFRQRHLEKTRWASRGRASAQFTHDVKTPLAGILGAAQYLEGEELTEEQQEFVTLIIDESRRLNETIVRYQDLENLTVHPSPVDASDFLGRWCRTRSVKFDFEQLTLKLLLDPTLVLNSLDNLWQNATESRASTVTMSAFENDRFLIVELIDNGDGIDVRDASRAKEYGFSTKETGSGYGLAFVERVMIAHGGRLDLMPNPLGGTIAQLSLPFVRAEPKPSMSAENESS